jgi:hypothetical protein
VEVPQKLKIELLNNHSWGYIQKNVSQNTIKTLAHQYLLQYCSQLSSYENNPNALQLMNELRKYDTHTHTHTQSGVLFSHK